jgi:hypothetical protein
VRRCDGSCAEQAWGEGIDGLLVSNRLAKRPVEIALTRWFNPINQPLFDLLVLINPSSLSFYFGEASQQAPLPKFFLSITTRPAHRLHYYHHH